jgi:outer membrane protein assembly factor BamB
MQGHLFAVDATTGKEKWHFKTLGNPDFPEGAIQSTPAVADGLVYFGSRDSFMYAVHASDGTLCWKFSHKGSWVITPPTVADGLVYVGSSDGRFVQSLDAKTGEERGHEALSGNVFGAVAISGRFAVSTDWDGGVIWRDAKTGKDRGMIVLEGRINSSPVLHNGLLYVGCDDDYIYAFGFAPAATK